MLSADSRAYDYLTTSMKIFASGKALIEILESHNFKLKKYKKFKDIILHKILKESLQTAKVV